MPADSGDSLLHIRETLQSSLCKQGAKSSLDQRLVSSAKQILMHKIEFRAAEKASHSYQLDSLRAKYTPLNAKSDKSSSPELLDSYKSSENVKASGESLPAPKVVLYPAERVHLEWKSVKRIGAGLVNLGNTCFLNSTLQCLSYTAPLVNYLVIDNHASKCKVPGFCMLCELQNHVQRCYDNSGSSIRPHSIVHKLRVIAKHMHLGRQEDAHEFLRYVVDHMLKSCLFGYSKLDRFSKETSAVNQIFGGYLRSQVLCLRCKARSNTYDPFLDISLDIKNSPSVLKAFERYVQPERLDSDNAYNCTKCKQMVPAQKRFTIHKVPNILTVQLKRFDCSRPSAKVTRHVHFPEKLDLRPFMSTRHEQAVTYQLYAVLVHSGYSCNSGHYYCFVKASNKMWYCMNDQHVSQTSFNRVMTAEAYLLFYQRCANTQPNTEKRPVIGPVMPNQTRPSQTKTATTVGAASSSDVGSPIARKPLQKTSTIVSHSQLYDTSATNVQKNLPTSTSIPSSSSSNVVNVPKPSVIPGVNQREKISFGIKQKEVPNDKPRIVVHIKNGKVSYNSSMEEKKVAERPKGLSKLVPYNGETDSSDEDEKLEEKKTTKSLSDLPKVSPKPNGPKLFKSASLSPPGKKKAIEDYEPMIDSCLNATTSVPGAYGSLDRFSGLGSAMRDRPTKFSKDDTHNILNKSRPFKRSFGDTGLSIDTCVSPTKINATTKWNVFDTDNQISPSVASGSSNGSINSTTEWHIRSSKKRELVAPGVQNSGWTVTPNKQTNGHKHLGTGPDSVANEGKYHETTHSDGSSDTGNLSSHSLPESRQKDQWLQNIPKISASDTEVHKKLKHGKRHGTFPFKMSCFSSVTDSPNEKELLIDKAYDLSVYDFNDGDEDNHTMKVPFHHSKSHPGTLTQEHLLSEKSNPVLSTATIDSVEATEHIGQPEEGSIESFRALHKKHKKNKKHKKKHKKHCKENAELPESGTTTETDISSHKKKKKKKKNKRKYEDEESDEEVKRKRESEEDNDTQTSEEYAWVEKSRDVTETPAYKPAVPVQAWDAHVKDSYKNTTHDSNMNPVSRDTKWDGSSHKTIDVLAELKKGSAWGLGSHVSTWEGEKNQLDQELDKEKRKDQKRTWEDDYEEDLDRGKMKKVKHGDNGHVGSQGNSFQKYQDVRNVDKERQKTGFLSPQREHHYDRSHSSSWVHKPAHHSYHSHPVSLHQHHKDSYHREGHNNKPGYYGNYPRY